MIWYFTFESNGKKYKSKREIDAKDEETAKYFIRGYYQSKYGIKIEKLTITGKEGTEGFIDFFKGFFK